MPLLSNGQRASTRQAMASAEYSPPPGELLMQCCTAEKARLHVALQAPCFSPLGQLFTFVTGQTTTARRDLFMARAASM